MHEQLGIVVGGRSQMQGRFKVFMILFEIYIFLVFGVCARKIERYEIFHHIVVIFCIVFLDLLKLLKLFLFILFNLLFLLLFHFLLLKFDLFVIFRRHYVFLEKHVLIIIHIQRLLPQLVHAIHRRPLRTFLFFDP